MFAQCQAQWGLDSGKEDAQTLLSLTVIMTDFPNHCSRHGAESSRCAEAAGAPPEHTPGCRTLSCQPGLLRAGPGQWPGQRAAGGCEAAGEETAGSREEAKAYALASLPGARVSLT